ncbi:MAG: polar amino acid transport system substrate-binding protein [Gammaproteobacteria bacterium]|jgi:polar amino acid transport system substrate-binding protein
MRRYLLAKVFSIFLLSFNVHAEVFTFVVADNEAPLSSGLDDTAIGLIPDIVNLVFSHLPDHQVRLKAYPWARAQLEVERGRADGLLTYPSKKRKGYASFTSSTLYKLDFGYLIYDKDNANRPEIESATSFADLKNLTIITQTGAEWESDNIPDYMHKVEANEVQAMFHLLMLRKQGDFLIMPPEQAIYIAKNSGYQDKIAYRQVDFINDSLIPFHLGVRQSHPLANALISEIDRVAGSDTFLTQVQGIVESYR